MRSRRLAVLGALLLSALLLQISVLPLVVGGGYAPDLLVVLVAVLTLEQGPRTGLWVAGLSGLLVDLAATTVPVGSSMLVMLLIAYLLSALRPYLAERAELTTALLAGLSAALAVVGHAAMAALLSAQTPPTLAVVSGSALVVGAFAVLLAPLVARIVRRTLDRPDASMAEVGG